MAISSRQSCPIDAFGNPRCYIVAPPDRPYEKFCATCGTPYREEDRFPPVLFFLAILLLAWLGQLETPSPDWDNPIVEPSTTESPVLRPPADRFGSGEA